MNTESLENIVYYHQIMNRFYKYLVIDKKTQMKDPERNFEIFCEVVLHGNSISYIASEYDISKSRVDQIITKMKRILCRMVSY
jgi:transcriptional regulator of met regulon